MIRGSVIPTSAFISAMMLYSLLIPIYTFLNKASCVLLHGVRKKGRKDGHLLSFPPAV
ncbi:hypothetical protein DPMN_067834 [Dreissena polymorpha]|uniref:Uncharacterized protein n=1 Tax=Dreissena polymorpha TaxID=45954 RepID=A0A9D3Z0H1_DREPO|nr:hypothetical protein DPMN_067834 [Dreissena polymorpha]